MRKKFRWYTCKWHNSRRSPIIISRFLSVVYHPHTYTLIFWMTLSFEWQCIRKEHKEKRRRTFANGLNSLSPPLAYSTNTHSAHHFHLMMKTMSDMKNFSRCMKSRNKARGARYYDSIISFIYVKYLLFVLRRRKVFHKGSWIWKLKNLHVNVYLSNSFKGTFKNTCKSFSSSEEENIL